MLTEEASSEICIAALHAEEDLSLSLKMTINPSILHKLHRLQLPQFFILKHPGMDNETVAGWDFFRGDNRTTLFTFKVDSFNPYN